MQDILKVTNLDKSYGKKQILNGVSFSVSAGDILALIGTNGSGKTTIIKMALGLQTIDSGNVVICGYDIVKEYTSAIKNVGAIVENPDFYMYMTGYKNLKLLADMYPNIPDEKLDELLDLVNLKDRKNEKVGKYSLGMRQRLGIAKALLNDPKLLILDEPTNGLDPSGIRDLRNLLLKLSKKGVGILISSHNLAELESFCNKVCILNEGSVSEIGNISSIKQKSKCYRFLVNDTSKIQLNNVSIVNKKEFSFEGSKEEVSNLIKELVNQGVDIYEVKLLELTLEDAFLDNIGGLSDKINKK